MHLSIYFVCFFLDWRYWNLNSVPCTC
jgi:hypothetical protein